MEVQYRKLVDLEVRSDPERIVATLSTEEPVGRHFGQEVLDHGAGSVDFSRAKDGLPLLWAHDPQQVVGRAERVRLTDRKLKADLRPGSSARAQEVWNDIRAGILPDLSIGYSTDDSAVRKEGEVTRFMRWTPFETSVVGVAADPRAKIGRSADLKLGDPDMSDSDKSNITVTEQPGENKRVREILGLGKLQNNRFMADAVRAVEDGTPLDQFRQSVLVKIGNPLPIDTPFIDGLNSIGLTPKEVRKYSFVRAIHAQASRDFSGAGFEVECSRAAAKIHGRDPEGLYVPGEVLSTRSLTAGSDPGGGYLVGTDHLASEFVELLRNKMLLVPLGARILTGLRGNVDIPTQTGAATAYWLGEDDAITPTDQTFGSINLTPHTVGALTRFTRKMLLQSSPDVEGVVRGDLAQVCAVAIDAVGINGAGSSNEPLGVLQTPNIAPITTSGTLTWAKILELTAAVENANADAGSLAFLTNAPTKSRLLGTVKETGFPTYLWEFAADGSGRMAGYRAFSSNNVPATLGVGNNKSAIIFGNWADVLIGQWGVLDLLSDPYTDMNKGAIRVRALMDVDVAVRHPASFAAAQDV